MQHVAGWHGPCVPPFQPGQGHDQCLGNGSNWNSEAIQPRIEGGMEKNSSIDKPEQLSCQVTQKQLAEKFAILREEASNRAENHRRRLEKAAGVRKFSKSRAVSPQDSAANPPRLETALNTTDVLSPVKAPQPSERRQVSKPQNFDLIALWSVVGPSTITAVFAGVAMSQSHIPIAYALAFIFAWFAITSCLALGAVKVFSTNAALGFMRTSAPRLGVAAISCALLSVLVVEATRISITAIAGSPPVQTTNKVGALGTSKSDPIQQPTRVAPSRTSLMSKSSAARSAFAANTQSTHYPTTPNVLPARPKQVQLEGTTDETVVALPAPAPELAGPVAKKTIAKSASRAPSQGELLGRISEKGKFVARRKNSKDRTKKTRLTVARKTNRQKSKQGSKNILEKIFDPVIDSAGAQPPSRGIGSEDDSLDRISR